MPNETETCPSCLQALENPGGFNHTIMEMTNGVEMCSRCASEHSDVDCDGCGLAIPRGDSSRISGQHLCLLCFDDQVGSCNDCGEDTFRDDLNDGLCEHCERQREEDFRDEDEAGNSVTGVFPYDYRVEDNLPFYGPSSDGVYLGVELELECFEDKQNIVDTLNTCFKLDLPDHKQVRVAVLKEDGSLDNGVEIVTAPMTYANQKVAWKNIGGAMEGMSGIKSHNTKTCGLHVHVSRRRVLTPLHVGKLVVFLNAPENEDFLAMLARRRNNTFAKFTKKKLTDYRGEERYEVLNLLNSATVEFRLFRGTTKTSTILATIDFVYSLVRYTKWCSSRALNHEQYIKWVWKEKDYLDLKRWFVEHNYHLNNRQETK